MSAALPCKLFRYLQEGASGMRERGLLPVDEAKLALEVQLTHWNADQFPATDFVFHADRRHHRHAIAHAYKTFDGLQSWQFDVHVQRGFVLAEGFDDFVTIR